MQLIKVQNTLANKLLEYEKDVNYYNYCDNYNDDKEAYDDILNTLRSSKGIDCILFSIQEDIDNFDGFFKNQPNNIYVKDMLNKSRNLFNEVKKYQKDMIDMEKEYWR